MMMIPQQLRPGLADDVRRAPKSRHLEPDQSLGLIDARLVILRQRHIVQLARGIRRSDQRLAGHVGSDGANSIIVGVIPPLPLLLLLWHLAGERRHGLEVIGATRRQLGQDRVHLLPLDEEGVVEARLARRHGRQMEQMQGRRIEQLVRRYGYHRDRGLADEAPPIVVHVHAARSRTTSSSCCALFLPHVYIILHDGPKMIEQSGGAPKS
mmetsp:Transcript_21078/g.60425  ORF Transcript_21078/g.60425 Transcript_21078/m.60425 type:complete len:210 (-) Transcript_21078:133-762(-)